MDRWIGMVLLLMTMWLGTTMSALPAQGQEAQALFDQSIAFRNAGGYGDPEKAANYTKSCDCMLQALNRDPNNPMYWEHAVWLCFMDFRYIDGVAGAKTAITRGMDRTPYFYHNAALCALANHDLDLARTWFRRALSMPGFDDAHKAEALNSLQELSNRTFVVTFPIKINSEKVAVHVPPSLPYQEVTYKVAGGSTAPAATADTVWLISKEMEATLEWTVVRKPYSYKKLINQSTTSSIIPTDVARYLKGSQYINPDTPLVRAKLAEMMLGKTDDERLMAISKWLKRNIRYQDNKDVPSTDETLTRRFAECREFSELYVAFARKLGYPSRVIWVTVIAPDLHLNDQMKGHLAVEVYLNGRGWIPLEPQDPKFIGMLPSHYIRVAHYDDVGVRQWPSELVDTPIYKETTAPGGR